jgi:hypothetical protein
MHPAKNIQRLLAERELLLLVVVVVAVCGLAP